MENKKLLIWVLWLIFLMDKGNATPYTDASYNIIGLQEDSFTPELDIYLLIGQSNMAGRAEMEEDDLISLDHVHLFNGSGWEKAKNPLNQYSTVRKNLEMQKIGPGYAFGKSLAKKQAVQ